MAVISSRVEKFIRGHITSVWQLELLMIFKNSPTPLTSDDVGRQVYIDSSILNPSICRFRDSGILVSLPDGHYKFAPEDINLTETIDELAHSYLDRKVAIINYIYDASFGEPE